MTNDEKYALELLKELTLVILALQAWNMRKRATAQEENKNK